jgi:hypothetical protein
MPVFVDSSAKIWVWVIFAIQSPPLEFTAVPTCDRDLSMSATETKSALER